MALSKNPSPQERLIHRTFRESLYTRANSKGSWMFPQVSYRQNDRRGRVRGGRSRFGAPRDAAFRRGRRRRHRLPT